nr:alpha-tocopherol transfer protein-like [Onthophagus taurus]
MRQSSNKRRIYKHLVKYHTRFSANSKMQPLSKLPFDEITEDAVKLVYKELGIEVEKLENCLKLVKEWLNCETHLPKDVDEVLMKNFILGSKGNVERTKEKLEKYIIAKTRMTNIYSDRVPKDEEFSLYPLQKVVFISPKHTPDGNRILLCRLPDKDPTHFNHLNLARYFCLTLDLLLFHDTSVGYNFIYDAAGFSPNILPKFNLRLLKEVSELIYKTSPMRIKSIQLVNDTATMSTIMNIGKAFMSQKLKDRISCVKMEELSKMYPKDCLPIEYGGTAGKIDDGNNNLLEILKENKDWCLKSEEPKLIGLIPDDKKNLYSFDDLSMNGSFRRLNVD